MYKCKYCGKEFSNPKAIGGHTVCCEKNPKSKDRIIKIAKSRTKKRKYELRCKRCEKKYTIEATPREIEKGRYRKFCSRSCANTRKLTKKVKLNISIGLKKSYINRDVYNKGKSERKKLMLEYFGEECYFCKFIANKKGVWTILHRKDGKEHKKPCTWTIEDLKNLDVENYVRLCGRCHHGVHWCMEYLGMSWEDIKKASVS